MRLLTFAQRRAPQNARIGAMLGDSVLDLQNAEQIWATGGGVSPIVPGTMKELLRLQTRGRERVQVLLDHARRSPDALRAAILAQSDIIFLPPVMDADKFLCVGKNNRTHLEELRRNNLLKETPQEPTGFIKVNSCLSGHDAKVVRPNGVVRLDYEPELAFVIGKPGVAIKKAEAMDYVAGVMLLNDLTCRDLQEREVAAGSRFWTGKNIPGFGPLGPYIITLDEIGDPHELWITCTVNGELRMRGNMRDQIYHIPDILEHFTRFIPVEPGDLFSTGAPGGVAVGHANAAQLYLKPGDVIEIGIEGYATLRTHIVAPEA
ncbi:MAG: fumarylacetoacetate hydrolase family protein [Rhodospirillaceae bacterium]